MNTPRIIALLLLPVVVGCGGPGRDRQQADPVSPSPVEARAGAATDDRSTPQNAGAAVADAPVALPPEDGATPSVITFPPRNEPVAFGLDLEVVYRDILRRGATLTFVDLEGAVVWIQEYLRYRLTGCGHLEAVTRVFLQIEGFGIQPVCSVFEFPFPPRDEPFNFYQLLELEYRDFLRRGQIPTFIDGEGKLVWIQEYLRYRVSGCSHTQASQRVLDQILGRGIQPECGATLRFAGTLQAFGFVGHPFNVTGVGASRLIADLAWADPTVDLDLYLTGPNCNGYPPRDCALLGASTAVGTNFERITRTVFGGEQYIVWADNLSVTRSQTYQVVLSVVSTLNASPSSPPTAVGGPIEGGRKPTGTTKTR